MRGETAMHQNGYAGFWIRAAARVIDFFAIITAYYLFYLINQLGAKAGLLPPVTVDAATQAEGIFSAISVIRGLFLFSFPIVYFTYLHGSHGQTFGKMAMGVKVINADGTPLNYWQAFRRWMVEIVFGSVLVFVLLFLLLIAMIVIQFVLSKISSFFSVMNYLQDAIDWVAGLAIVLLSNIPLGIMFIPAAFDPRKQGLHDRICHTLVVRCDRHHIGVPASAPPATRPPAEAPSADEPGNAPLDKGPEGGV
jgi:uncharacterized RDD family membrane protein YckC